ncbi:MAG: hypothetical protein ACYDAK_12845 [Candidatus Limnocylindrales bacterium]
MKKFSAFMLLMLLAACGSMGDAGAQSINETKTDRLLVGPTTGASAYLSVGYVSNAFSYLAGPFSGTGGSVGGFINSINLHPDVGLNAYGYWGAANVTTPAAGTNAYVDQMHLTAPIITAGGASVTNATTLNIQNAPTGATHNRSVWVQSGITELDGDLYLGPNIIESATAPTIASGFGTSPTLTASNTAAFTVTAGTGGTSYQGEFTMPTAAHGWVCTGHELGVASSLIQQTAVSPTDVQVSNYNSTTGANLPWAAGFTILFQCAAY